MFIGHYGVAFGAKAVFPDAPLPMLMLSTQMIDVAWSALVLARIERVEIDPEATPTVPVRLTYMPYSHGLLGALALSATCAVLASFIYDGLAAETLWVIALVCFSHWLLDLIVHDRDMPLIGNRFHVGFGLWRHRRASIALEFAVIALGLLMFAATGEVAMWKLAIAGGVMVAVQCISFFAPPPPSPNQLASTMLAVFIGMILMGWWLTA